MIKVGKILGIMEILEGFFLIFLLLWIFLWGILGAARSTRTFWGGDFGSNSEQLGALGVWRRWWGLGLGWGWR